MKTSDKIFIGILATVIALFIGAVALSLLDRPAELSGLDYPSRTTGAPGKPVRPSKTPVPEKESEYVPIEIPETLPDDRPTGPCAIAGRIIDTSGAPVTAARVTALGHEGFSRHTISDSNGTFEIIALPAGSYTLEAEHRDFSVAEYRGITLQGEDRKEGVEIIMHRGASLRIEVSDPAGAPIPGARLSLRPENREGSSRNPRTNSRRNGLTDDRGEAFFENLAPGGYVVRIRKRGYYHTEGSGQFQVAEGTINTHKCVLEKGGSVSGTIYDETGKPAKGARITLNGQTSAGRRLTRSYPRTRMDGAYRFDAVPSGTYDVTARLNGYIEKTVENLVLRPEEAIEDISINLSRGGSISGRVLLEDGTPVRGVKVFAYWENRFSYAITDNEGDFLIQGLEGDEFRLQAYKRGFTKALREGVTMGSANVELVLEPAEAVPPGADPLPPPRRRLHEKPKREHRLEPPGRQKVVPVKPGDG